jgi:hypothetical protein
MSKKNSKKTTRDFQPFHNPSKSCDPTYANPVLGTARRYLRAGLSLIPVRRDGSKAPDGRLLPCVVDEATGKGKATWGPYTEHLPTETELHRWFTRPPPAGSLPLKRWKPSKAERNALRPFWRCAMPVWFPTWE